MTTKTLTVPGHFPAPKARRFAGCDVKVEFCLPAPGVGKLKTIDVVLSRDHAKALVASLTALLSEMGQS